MDGRWHVMLSQEGYGTVEWTVVKGDRLVTIRNRRQARRRRRQAERSYRRLYGRHATSWHKFFIVKGT